MRYKILCFQKNSCRKNKRNNDNIGKKISKKEKVMYNNEFRDVYVQCVDKLEQVREVMEESLASITKQSEAIKA